MVRNSAVASGRRCRPPRAGRAGKPSALLVAALDDKVVVTIDGEPNDEGRHHLLVRRGEQRGLRRRRHTGLFLSILVARTSAPVDLLTS